MNKEQFLKELEELLSDIPEQEREAALTYYREYFEDAGVENEYLVLKELGSPERIAGTIISDMEFRKKEEQETVVETKGEETENTSEKQGKATTEQTQKNTKSFQGYTNVSYSGGNFNNTACQNGVYTEEPKKKSNKTLWVVLGCVFGGLALVIGVYALVIRLFVGQVNSFVSNIKTKTENSLGDVVDYEWTTTLEECGSFTQINVSVDAGTLEIYQSESDKLEVYGYSVSTYFEPYIENGVLFLNEDMEAGDYFFSDTSEIQIFLPKQEYQDVVIKLGAGSGYMENLIATDVSIDVGAGEMGADGLTVNENLSLQIGAGQADINNVTAKNIEINCGIGEVNVSGEIYGDGDIDCGVGEVNLNLLDSLTLHNYDVTCDLGEVTIGNDTITMGGRYIDNAAEREIKVKCGAGEINIE